MKTPKYFIVDVDGVMTTGQFLYSINGKFYKIFGAHDSDGLKMLRKFIKIIFLTADKKGFKISKKRITNDLGYKIKLVSEENRYDFLKKKFGLSNIIYMADGYHDSKILKECAYGIAPKNARLESLKSADFVTKSKSAEGAVMDGCLKIISKFFNKKNAKK